jgi:hypothetical protein
MDIRALDLDLTNGEGHHCSMGLEDWAAVVGSHPAVDSHLVVDSHPAVDTAAFDNHSGGSLAVFPPEQ